MVRFSPVESRKSLAGQWVCVCAWLAVTLIALFLTPSSEGHGTHRQLGLPPCAAVVMFGRPCPGCGLTTSWTATVHGQWQVAMQAHPLGPLLYVAFTAVTAVSGYGLAKKLAITMTKQGNWLLIGAVAIYVIFGFWRTANPPPFYRLTPMFAPGYESWQPSSMRK